MDALQIKELKEIKSENVKLKQMFADQSLQITMLKEVLKKGGKVLFQLNYRKIILEKCDSSIKSTVRHFKFILY